MSLATFIQASAHSLPMLPDGSVQMIATSPPYYGLRSYAGEQGVEWPAVTFRLNEWVEPTTVPGCDPNCEHEWVNAVDLAEGVLGHSIPQKRAGNDYCARCGGWRGGLGMEPSPVAYLAHLILCLREWRRVLRDDGVCFVNLGDSYAGSGKGAWDASPERKAKVKEVYLPTRAMSPQSGKTPHGLKPKDLLMIPAMFAIAARADGWYLRSDIVWAKPNPMPESVTDRPTKAHEYIFLLAKSARYYWDAEAVKEGAIYGRTENGDMYGRAREADPRDKRGNERGANRIVPGAEKSRNLRTVWNVATQPFPGGHFACFPERLVEPMIKAGSRPGDVVLDPFSGSGTTCKVAVRLGRRAIGVDVSAEYLDDVTAQRFGAGVQMELVA